MITLTISKDNIDVNGGNGPVLSSPKHGGVMGMDKQQLGSGSTANLANLMMEEISHSAMNKLPERDVDAEAQDLYEEYTQESITEEAMRPNYVNPIQRRLQKVRPPTRPKVLRSDGKSDYAGGGVDDSSENLGASQFSDDSESFSRTMSYSQIQKQKVDRLSQPKHRKVTSDSDNEKTSSDDGEDRITPEKPKRPKYKTQLPREHPSFKASAKISDNDSEHHSSSSENEKTQASSPLGGTSSSRKAQPRKSPTTGTKTSSAQLPPVRGTPSVQPFKHVMAKHQKQQPTKQTNIPEGAELTRMDFWTSRQEHPGFFGAHLHNTAVSSGAPTPTFNGGGAYSHPYPHHPHHGSRASSAHSGILSPFRSQVSSTVGGDGKRISPWRLRIREFRKQKDFELVELCQTFQLLCDARNHSRILGTVEEYQKRKLRQRKTNKRAAKRHANQEREWYDDPFPVPAGAGAGGAGVGLGETQASLDSSGYGSTGGGKSPGAGGANDVTSWLPMNSTMPNAPLETSSQIRGLQTRFRTQLDEFISATFKALDQSETGLITFAQYCFFINHLSVNIGLPAPLYPEKRAFFEEMIRQTGGSGQQQNLAKANRVSYPQVRRQVRTMLEKHRQTLREQEIADGKASDSEHSDHSRAAKPTSPKRTEEKAKPKGPTSPTIKPSASPSPPPVVEAKKAVKPTEKPRQSRSRSRSNSRSQSRSRSRSGSRQSDRSEKETPKSKAKDTDEARGSEAEHRSRSPSASSRSRSRSRSPENDSEKEEDDDHSDGSSSKKSSSASGSSSSSESD